MGTSNFYKVRATKYFTTMMGYEHDQLDEEGNPTGDTDYRLPDELECEMILEGIQEVLSAKWKGYSIDGKTTARDNLRSFNSTVLGSFRDCKSFGDCEVAIHVTVCIRGAYYEGATLDYYFDFEIDDTFDEIPDNEEIAESLEMIWGFSPGLAKIQSKNITNWFKSMDEEYEEEVEKVLESISTPLEVSARFSNGETWYAESA